MLETHGLAPAILAAVNASLSDQGMLLGQGTVVGTTFIHAPSSISNESQVCDSEVRSARKGSLWSFGIKAHIDIDVDSGLVQVAVATAANIAEVVEVYKLQNGKEAPVHADAGFTGAEKWAPKGERKWHGCQRGVSTRCLEATSVVPPGAGST